MKLKRQTKLNCRPKPVWKLFESTWNFHININFWDLQCTLLYSSILFDTLHQGGVWNLSSQGDTSRNMTVCWRTPSNRHMAVVTLLGLFVQKQLLHRSCLHTLHSVMFSVPRPSLMWIWLGRAGPVCKFRN